MKSLTSLLLILLLFLLSANQAGAAILFQDDFNDGDASDWTVIKGGNLWRVENGRYGGRIDSPSTEIISVAGEIPSSSYIIELDIAPIVGADKNIVFRWKDYSSLVSGPLYHYSAHFNDDNGGTLHLKKFGPSQNGWPVTVPAVLSLNQSHKIKVVLKEQKVDVYMDGSKLASGTDPDYIHEGNERVMLYISTGGSFPTEVWFDNIIVKTLDENNANLDVPLLKQTSEPWQAQVYDSANIWSPLNPTINRWGCALTSVAMILRYHGINKMPNIAQVDPGSVNLWLKSQQDGYVRNGLINWLAVSRLSKDAILSGSNPGLSFDALEYKRIDGYDPLYLSNLLSNNIPAVLEEPGHFIVAKGKDEATFSINDPFFNRLTLNDGYSNSFLSLGEYTPHNTDLSYIMLVVPTGINITLTDADGNSVGNQFIQQPISDPLSTQKSGQPLRTIYLQKPNSENYFANLSSTTIQNYTLDSYFYDVNGEVSLFTNKGTLFPNSVRRLPIVFDNSDSQNSKIKKDVTFRSIIDYINEAVRQGKVKSSAAKALITVLKTAEKSSIKNPKLARAQLAATEVVLLALKKSKGVTQEAYSTISADIRELSLSL